MIRAEVHSDDYAVKIKFDAEPWFVQADDADIVDLAACGWGGDYPADNVALFFSDTTAYFLFDYIGVMQKSSRNPPGFECHVDEGDAMAWLRANRPALNVR